PRDSVRTLQRCSRRQLHVHEQKAVVLLRQEAGRQFLADSQIQQEKTRQYGHSDRGFPNEPVTHAHITAAELFERSVESLEEAAQQALRLFPWSKQHRSKRRRESERVECRNEHGNRHRHRKLLIQLPL